MGGVEFSNSVNHDQKQVLDYVKYSLFLPVIRTEPAICRWFCLELYKLNTYICYTTGPAGLNKEFGSKFCEGS